MWPAALDDLRQRRAHRAPDAEQVDLEDPLPFLGRDPARGRHRRLGDAGVGDDDVEAAEALDRLGDGRHDRPVVGDVGGDPDRPLADPLGRLARLLGVEVDDRDRGAAQVHLARRLEADPARGAGDQRHLSVQVVGGHAARSLSPPRITRSCPASTPSTRSSPSPSWRSACWRAGASATSSTARSPTARGPRSGASTRARRPPTAAPAPTTSSPASSRTSTRATGRCAATGCRARPAGTATGCRSSSRSRSSSASPPSRRSRSTGSPSSTSAAASRSSSTSRSGTG